MLRSTASVNGPLIGKFALPGAPAEFGLGHEAVNGVRIDGRGRLLPRGQQIDPLTRRQRSSQSRRASRDAQANRAREPDPGFSRSSNDPGGGLFETRPGPTVVEYGSEYHFDADVSPVAPNRTDERVPGLKLPVDAQAGTHAVDHESLSTVLTERCHQHVSPGAVRSCDLTCPQDTDREVTRPTSQDPAEY